MTNSPIKTQFLGDAPYQGGQLLHNILLFGRVCKALGMEVTPDRLMEATRALQLIRLINKTDFYYTLRGLIVTRHRDLELFDEAFTLFWRRPSDSQTTLDLQSLGESRRKKKTQFLPPPAATPDDDPNTPESDKPAIDTSLISIVPTFSQQEILRKKDFAEMTAEELAMARQMIERMPKSLGLRRSRRFRAGKGKLIDMRRTFRSSLRYAGEPLELPNRARKLKPRPLILICDISGSMERYSHMLLHFMHIMANSMYQVESFVFSTRLTSITHPIRHQSIDIALRQISTKVKDWGGGTRTSDALHHFNFHWGRRVLGRGAVVLLITDGWDRGDPDLLRDEMARLQRSCQRLIWLNPLLGADQYEPLTRGAQAMLPYVHDFLPVRNLSNLEMLMALLRKLE